MLIWCRASLQAVEAKEGVKVGSDSVTQASITYQCFFRYYPKLAGMTVSCLAFFVFVLLHCVLTAVPAFKTIASRVLLQMVVQACQHDTKLLVLCTPELSMCEFNALAIRYTV